MAVATISATSSGNESSAGSTTAFAVTLPTHSTGDILVVIVNGTNTDVNRPPIASVGWTFHRELAVGGDAWRGTWMFWKKAESASETVNFVYLSTYWSATYVCLAITGASTPYECDWRFQASGNSAASATTLDAPTPAVDENDSLVLHILHGNRSGTSSTRPSGTIAVVSKNSGTNNEGSINVARVDGGVSAGTVAAATWTALTDWHYKQAFVVVVPPATATARTPLIKAQAMTQAYDSASPYTITATLPTYSVGDTLLMCVSVSAAGSGTMTVVQPSGWDEVYNYAGTVGLAVFKRVSTGSDAVTVTWTGGTARAMLHVYAISGCGTSILASGEHVSDGTTGSTWPAVADTTAGSLVIGFLGSGGKDLYSLYLDASGDSATLHRRWNDSGITLCTQVLRGLSTGTSVPSVDWSGETVTQKRTSATVVVPPTASPGGGFVRYQTLRNPSQLAGPASAGQRLVIF